MIVLDARPPVWNPARRARTLARTRKQQSRTLPSVPGYETIPGLESLYLEDSWVLGVYETHASLSLDLEAVLTDDHPQWEPRKRGEVHSYRRVSLTFPNVREIEWLSRGGPSAIDASGESDRGHIDTFVVSADTYELTGDWGHARLTSDAPYVQDR